MSSPTTICFTVTATLLGWGQMQWGIGPWGQGQQRLFTQEELGRSPATQICFTVTVPES
jgi:hypothetical protein